MASIAFAAIGTGTLQFPRDQVASIYFNEVMSYSQRHPQASVKDVRFVLYDKDVPTIQAFQAAELTKQNSGSNVAKKATDSRRKRSGENTSSNGSSTFSPVKERTPNHLETTVGSLCFQVKPGDITKETTEAIAFISNSQLDISASGTGAAILRSGGDAIKDECSRNAPQSPGSVVITAAGKLKARYLCHIVPSDLTPIGMKACLVQCLQEAERKSISSISFPAIGTGILGVSAKSCASAMLSAILELSEQKSTSLKLIRMTIFQENMIKDIRSALEEASGAKPKEPRWRKVIGNSFKTVASVLGFGSSDDSTDISTGTQEADSRKVDLLVFAGCKEDLQGALKAVSELMKENCKQKEINHEAISSLTKEHMHRIHALELRYSIEVTVEKEVERIILNGQYEDILQVFGEIHEILHEVKRNEHERSHAEALSKDIQWKYKDGEKFENYESDINAQIELAYQQNKSSVIIMRDEEEYKISFHAMTEEDEDRNTNEVRRTDLRKGTQRRTF